MSRYTYIFCLVNRLTADRGVCNTDVMTVDVRKHKKLGGGHAPLTLRPSQIPHGFFWHVTRVSAVRNQQITTALLFIVHLKIDPEENERDWILVEAH